MGVADRRQREREARVTAVLDAARSLLLERGFIGATTREIARHCELSEATLFFYFKNKDEIFISLLFEGIDFWTTALKKIQKTESGPEKKLLQIWQLFKTVHEEHPEYYLLSAYLAQPYATANVSESIRIKIIRDSGANFQRLADLLEDISGRADGRIMADTMWACFLGLTVLGGSRLNLKSGAHPTENDFARVFEILRNGIFASGGNEKGDE
jgi:AcrR family transcriptional regulator